MTKKKTEIPKPPRSKRKQRIRRGERRKDQDELVLQGVQITFTDGYAAGVFQDGDDFATMSSGLNIVRSNTGHVAVDGFGLPEHEHTAVELSVGSRFWPLFDALVRDHGLVRDLQPFYMRYLRDPEQKHLYWVVLAGSHTGFGVLGARMLLPDKQTAQILRDSTKAGSPPVEIPEHEHWAPTAAPMDPSAAMWIFRAITLDQLKAGLVACNCRPPQPAAPVFARPICGQPNDTGTLVCTKVPNHDSDCLFLRPVPDSEYEDA